MINNRSAFGVKLFFLILILSISTAPVSAAQRMSIKGTRANIRSGPGTNYDILWQVAKYHPLKIIKKQGDWYRFKDFEGDYGWIHKSLVTKTSTVITTRKKCNVRSGPGEKNRIVFTTEKGISFKVLKRSGNWIRIQHADGDVGWIYKSLVW